MSTIKSPSDVSAPIHRTSVAWDVELADADLAGGDYTPACGVCRGFVLFSTGSNAGTLGNVQIVTPAGHTVTIPVSIGMLDNQQCYAFSKIVKAGTTATGIFALA